MDFSEIKRTLKAIAESLDHRVLLAAHNPHITIRHDGEEIEAVYLGKRYVFPEADVVILDLPSMTAEMMSEYIAKEFVERASIPDNIVKIKAGIDEGPGQGAWSTLTLKK